MKMVWYERILYEFSWWYRLRLYNYGSKTYRRIEKVLARKLFLTYCWMARLNNWAIHRGERRSEQRENVKCNNPYTCRLLIRIDKVLYEIRGKYPYWSSCGHLCIDHGQTKSHFPGWVFRYMATVQNRWLWTRRVLSI